MSFLFSVALRGFFYSFSCPETNTDFILLKRAKRLRKSTGNENLRSDSEIKQGNIHFLSLLGGYLTTPFLVTLKDPSIAFINVYTGLIYGIFVSRGTARVSGLIEE
jgi:hypothetical protein